MIEGLKGFGEGIENGSLAFFNALTGGAYDVFSYSYMNNDYAKRQEKMQKLAESANLGREYRYRPSWQNLKNFFRSKVVFPVLNFCMDLLLPVLHVPY